MISEGHKKQHYQFLVVIRLVATCIMLPNYQRLLQHYYIRQLNGVKLSDIRFYLRFRPSVHPSARLCALVFRCKSKTV